MCDHTMTSVMLEKTDSEWPLCCQIVDHEIAAGAWVTTQYQLVGFDLMPTVDCKHVLFLSLKVEERNEYRANLNTPHPKLFVVLDKQSDNAEGVKAKDLTLSLVTASPNTADGHKNKGHLVLSTGMPLAVQTWMEAYVGEQTALFDTKRRKRRR